MAEGTVTIKGRADLGQLNRAVDKLDSRVKKVDRSATSMRASLRAAGTALVGLGAAVGVSGAGLSKLIDDTLQARLELNNLANTAGVTAPTFGTLAKAAELAGKSSEALVGGLSALRIAAFEASRGNATAAQKFDELGVAVVDASGQLRSTEDVFKDVLTQLGEIPNETERAARAQQLMGESAGALRAALGELSIEGFEAAEVKARAFTRGLTDEGIAAAASYEAALTKLDAVMRSVGDGVSDFAGPALNALVDGLTFASVFISETFNATMERLGERVFLTVEAVKSLGPVLTKVFEGDLRGAYQEMQSADEAIRELRESMGLGLVPIVSDVGDIFDRASTKARETVDALNQVHDATRDVTSSSSPAAASIRDMSQALGEFNETAITFLDSADQIRLEPLGEDPEEVIGSVDRLNEATLSYLHSVHALADAPPLISEQALGDIDAFVSGFTAVAGIVGDLAGLYVDAALQSDNLTEKQKQAAKTAFNVQKAANLATAVVNTALGVTQALASAPPPLSFVNAGLVGAAGAVAIAEIAGQRPPSFAAGGMMPSTGGPAILHPGEGVLSAGAVDSLGGVSALDALNGRSAMGGGGTVVVSWKHLRQSFAYEARDAANRPGPLRSIRRDGRRAGQMRRAVRADYGSL
jgi:hypothetical protein